MNGSLMVRTSVLLLTLLTVSGCSHRLSPLYKDYRIGAASSAGTNLHTVIEQAVVDAGWTIDTPDAPNAISTEESTVAHWGLYKVVVSLDVVPINHSHVRVFVHPYRVYVWGSRSKMLYMSRRIRNFVVPGLTESLSDRGIIAVDVDLEDVAG